MNVFSMTPRLLFLLPMALLLVACSSIPGMDAVLPDRKVEYKKSRQAERDLEIPPDLTRTAINDELVIPAAAPGAEPTLSGMQRREQRVGRVAGRDKVLPEFKGIELKRDGDKHWLLIQADPEDVWYRVLEFWQENGVLLEQQDPTIGVMVTDWLEEKPDVQLGVVNSIISEFAGGLYSAGTRDQFRVRIEPGPQPDTTELFLTHRGLQETVIQDGAGQVERTVWNPRPVDPGLETEMLRRLMVYLGVPPDQAGRALAGKEKGARTQRSRLNKSGDQVSLEIDADRDRAWRLVGVGLDRVGFAVEDRDREAGVYFVRYYDPIANQKEEGFLDKLAFWSSDESPVDKEAQYQVRLEPDGDRTRVTVADEQGRRLNTETAQRILTLLHEQIR
ncbi:MAG TPA: outer membrane protein assembly factor BamC [Sedimenticola thiotaurini]|uniref:Outer membrane protein assembly factor BamC n=1 Tax=Sedimenticola thiotaurini TaxID=1543721 RepID=A0A831RNI2_9GAMM|nr:outer membrane protein assembly factor BamC [Sedimenticola thiotaurini]